MVWVVVANTNDCKIYHFQKKPAQITFLKELSQIENKLKASESLTTDKPGRYNAANSNGGAFSPHTDPKKVEFDNFARKIAQALNHDRNEQEFEELIIAAEPHMHGLITQHLDKHVKHMIIRDLQKDLINLPEKELLAYLLKHTRYENE
jgi:protein required for attachment to host cells